MGLYYVRVMDTAVNLETGGNVVAINSPQKKIDSTALFLTLSLLLFTLAAISFLSGFVVGKMVINQPETDKIRKPAIISDQKNGNSLLSDPNENYQISFPN